MLAVHTKYIGPSNTKGSRIKAYFSDGRSITRPVDHALDGMKRHAVVAQELIAKELRHSPDCGLVYGDSADGKGYVFCFAVSRVDSDYATV
jgi:hypothetical protein